MIIDPSRVLLLGEYATLAESGSEAELGAREAEVRVFIEALWSAAGPGGRQRFMKSVAGQSSAMPWIAVRVPELIESAERGAPPVVELLLDTKPLGDEDIPEYHLEDHDEAAQRVLTAIRAWEWDVLHPILTPSGWRLEDIGEGSPEDSSAADDDAAIDPTSEAGNDEEESGGALVFPGDVTATKPWWPWALAAGGIGVVGSFLWLTADRED